MSQLFSLLLICGLIPSLLAEDTTCDCATRADDWGPYFFENAPKTNVLAPQHKMTPEFRIDVSGRVLDWHCQGVPNVIIDIWHAGGGGG